MAIVTGTLNPKLKMADIVELTRKREEGKPGDDSHHHPAQPSKNGCANRIMMTITIPNRSNTLAKAPLLAEEWAYYWVPRRQAQFPPQLGRFVGYT